VAVNVCSRQLHPSGFPAQVMQTLSDTGLAPDALVLEITQADLFDDLDDSLAELRGLGVRVALDDFGIGRISVRGLADLPLDAVKLDRAIVGNLPADAGDRAVTRSVIALAHDVGLEVCAEGVETEEQREFLGALGCDAAGGGICSAGRWRRRRSSGGSGARPQRSAATNSEPMRRGEPPRGVKITL
jgi:EAL domain-containing protein (putative c-di-GMP-specific phosphodiesterase class I)